MSGYKRKLLTIEPDDLIGYWLLDESAGDTAEDSSGNDHAGAVNNLTWGEDGIGDGGTAAAFNGGSSYVDVYSTNLRDLFDGDEGTLLAWARVSDSGVWTDGALRYVAFFMVDANNVVLIRKSMTNNTLTFEYHAGGVTEFVNHSGMSTLGMMCLALTWSKTADIVRAYVDGVQVGTSSTLGTWAGTLASTKATWGANTTAPWEVWSGDIAHCALWKKALTPTQIGDLAKLYVMPSSILSAETASPPLVRGVGPTTWSIAIDWDRSGSFDGTNDDVTDEVISARWFLGARKPYQDTPDDSMLTLVLKNADQRFSPENASSPLTGKLSPFKPVRIQSNDGLVTHTHWLGWIETIQPAVNFNGERTVEITAAGPMQFYKAAETALPLQENMRTDEIIAELIKEVVIPPALVGAWVLGRVGNSELGQSTRLASLTQYSELDVGVTTLAMAADNWVQRGGANDQEKDTFDVYNAVKDVVAAERGRFLFSRGGKAWFWNRHRLLDEEDVVTALDNTMNGLEYQYAGLEDLKNEVVVVCHPRTVGTSDQDVLWQLEDEVRVPVGETRTVHAKFEDGSDNRIGGKDVTISDVEFRFEEQSQYEDQFYNGTIEDGSRSAKGENQQGDGSASLSADVRANSVVLEITNDGDLEAFLTQCIIRGKKITDYGRMEASAKDGASIIDYGRRTLRLNLPSVDNHGDAQLIADFELHRRSTPRGMVKSVSLSSHGEDGGNQHTQQLVRSFGDRITVVEEQTEHSSDYYIVGELHKLSAGASLLETTWHLEPAPDEFPWKLGVEGRSELGQTTVLTY